MHGMAGCIEAAADACTGGGKCKRLHDALLRMLRVGRRGRALNFVGKRRRSIEGALQIIQHIWRDRMARTGAVD